MNPYAYNPMASSVGSMLQSFLAAKQFKMQQEQQATENQYRQSLLNLSKAETAQKAEESKVRMDYMRAQTGLMRANTATKGVLGPDEIAGYTDAIVSSIRGQFPLPFRKNIRFHNIAPIYQTWQAAVGYENKTDAERDQLDAIFDSAIMSHFKEEAEWSNTDGRVRRLRPRKGSDPASDEGEEMDEETAMQIYLEAGGDPDKARALARERGFKVPK